MNFQPEQVSIRVEEENENEHEHSERLEEGSVCSRHSVNSSDGDDLEKEGDDLNVTASTFISINPDDGTSLVPNENDTSWTDSSILIHRTAPHHDLNEYDKDEPLTSLQAPSYEVERKGKSGFVHIITASYPFQVIVAGQQRIGFSKRRCTRCWKSKSYTTQRRLRYSLAILGIVLLLLTAVLIPTKAGKGKPQLSSTQTELSSDTTSGEHSDLASDDEFEYFENRTRIVFPPFSMQDPSDFFPATDRPQVSRPPQRLAPLRKTATDSSSSSSLKAAIPTNAWYQNLLLLQDGERPTSNHRVYTQPYMIGTAASSSSPSLNVDNIPGIYISMGSVETTSDQVIVSSMATTTAVLGASYAFNMNSASASNLNSEYEVVAATDLGVTLEWSFSKMRSSIVRGMPYATMIYPAEESPDVNVDSSASSNIRPTLSILNSLSEATFIIDGDEPVSASSLCDPSSTASFMVQSYLEINMLSSEETFLLFLSSPQTISCDDSSGTNQLQIVRSPTALEESLILRLAAIPPTLEVELINEYKELLIKHAHIYPGEDTTVRYELGTETQAAVIFDWDARNWRNSSADGNINEDGVNDQMIMFAMPHQQTQLNLVTAAETDARFCADVLLGNVCLAGGNEWALVERLPDISFQAPRSPDPSMLPQLIDAVDSDLSYRVANNFLIGASDTYFSGKALGKLARILLIAEEVQNICVTQRHRFRSLQSDACSQTTTWPAKMEAALDHLREATEVWLYGAAQAPLLFDTTWGGIVSCGCTYAGGVCQNQFPTCPGLMDKLLNFGAGFYNDHHFHYGYHIYAAATLAHFDRDWGKANFDRVLMLVRDVANPSSDDPAFPLARHKDWYHGSSWASGISLPISSTGMNQESSSEAIAGYEAVALFGKTMVSIFEDEIDVQKQQTAQNIYQFGRLLTATELRSAKRYWHLSREDAVFNDPYQHSVVGILWSSKVFFGTWFGNNPAWIYGIQLLPITSIAEERDDIDWVREAFDSYAQTCTSGCVSGGWGIQVLALLATLGHREKALSYVLDLPSSVYTSPGGNGHSQSNTIWYIATRPYQDETYTLQRTYPWENGPTNVSCNQPAACTARILDASAGDFTCRERITYLMDAQGKSERAACRQIAVDEFPRVCGACNPGRSTTGSGNPQEDSVVSEPIIEPIQSNSGGNIDCNQPATCTFDALGTNAGGFSCESRIDWLMRSNGLTEVAACRQVAIVEFPAQCGRCNPN